MEFIGAMQDSRIPNHCIMDYVSEMHGGPENVPVTSQDMRKPVSHNFILILALHIYLNTDCALNGLPFIKFTKQEGS